MTEENWKEKVQEFIKQLKAEKLEDRQEAAWNLHKHAEEGIKEAAEAIPALIEAMKDDDWAVRKMSIMALGELNVEKLIPTIIDVLKNDIESEVRVGAAEALGDMKAAQAVPQLIKALDDSNEMVCHVTIYSLGQIGKEAVAAVPKLIELLATPEGVGFVQTFNLAAWALGEIGDKSAIKPLEEALNKAAVHEDKFEIAYSLALIEGPSGIGFTELKRMKTSFELNDGQLEQYEKLLKEFGSNGSYRSS
ncbi:MAG: HEAT repeat domain-containing protein [Candidatus Heimdallarchaeota archaeon]